MRIERRAAREIREALEEQLDAAVEGLTPEAGAIIRAEAQLDEASASLLERFKRMLLNAAAAGVQTGVGQLETLGLGVDWTLINEAARDWVLGFNPEQLGGKLAELYDQVQASSKRTLRQEIASWIGSSEKLEDLVKRLETTFGRQRAELIASTETTRAYAEGNTLAYRESGVVDDREWRTAADERVCPICGPLHKKRATLGSPFEGRHDNPPAHPRCRCWVVPVIDIPRQGRG